MTKLFLIKKSSIKVFFISLLIFVFLFGRYFVSLQNAYFTFVTEWKGVINISIFILLLISFLSIKYNQKTILMFLLFCLFTFLYQTNEYFSINHIFFFFIAMYLIKLYSLNKKLIFTLFFYSGLAYLFLLAYLVFDGKGFLLFYEKSIYGRNYIGSVITVFVLSGLALEALKSNIVSVFGLAVLLVLKFRTSLASISLFAFLQYKSNKYFYISILFLLLGIEFTMGISSIVYKWGESTSITGGRTGPWIYYINFIVDNFPNSLFPYIFTEINSNMPVYSYFSHAEGLYHAPHNLFIDLLYRLGIVFGSLVIMLLILPIIFVKNNILERNIYSALLIFGMFEPTVGFSANLISLFFYIMLFYLYSNMKFTYGGKKNEKTINNNN